MAEIDDAARTAPGSAATTVAVCPFLHLEHDPSTSASFAHESHACFKVLPPATVIARVQERFCLSAGYARCPLYRDEVSRPPRPGMRLPRFETRQVVSLVAFAVLMPALLGAGLALLTDDDPPSRAASVTATTTGLLVDEDGLASSLREDGQDPGSQAAAATAGGSEPTALEALRGWSRVALYDVRSGDTLSALALAYDTTVEAIVVYNGFPNDEIFEGQRIEIPSGFMRGLSEARGSSDEAVSEIEVVVEPEASESDGAGAGAPAGEGSLAALVEQHGAIGALRAWTAVAAYTILAGDSLSLVAAEFATSAEAIAVLNDLQGGELFIGAVLQIPAGFDIDLKGGGPPIDEPLVVLRNWPTLLEYRVAQGDALSFIADEFGTTPEAVAQYNGLEGNLVVLGQTLIVPLNFELPLPELEPVREKLLQDGPGGVGRVDDDDLAAILVGVPDDPVIALRLWRDRTTYTPRSGDSLFAIADDFNTSVDAIRVLNGLLRGEFLQIGVPLEVPVGFKRVLEANP